MRRFLPRSQHVRLDSSDSEEERGASVSTAYKSLDIRSGLQSCELYASAVAELHAIVGGLYKGRSFDKVARRLVEEDIMVAIKSMDG